MLSFLSCYCAVLSSLSKPSSSAHLPSPCFTPYYCFLCSFPSHYFLCSPFRSYPLPAGSCCIHVYSTGCALGAGSAGPWPILALSLLLISPAARSTRASKFICTHTLTHVCTNSFVYCEPLRVLSLHLHTHTHILMLVLFTRAQFVSSMVIFTLTHTHTLHLLAAGLIAWKMNTKWRAKWLAGITLAVCSSLPVLCRHETGAPPYLSLHSDIPGPHSLVRGHSNM